MTAAEKEKESKLNLKELLYPQHLCRSVYNFRLSVCFHTVCSFAKLSLLSTYFSSPEPKGSEDELI